VVPPVQEQQAGRQRVLEGGQRARAEEEEHPRKQRGLAGARPRVEVAAEVPPMVEVGEEQRQPWAVEAAQKKKKKLWVVSLTVLRCMHLRL
jgi:hypothetical protein